jgi:hypothetical protein
VTSCGPCVLLPRVRPRLQSQECLHQELRQLPQQLPPDATAALAHLSGQAPRRGSKRAARARQAHALGLAEADVPHEKWWAPLKALNTHHSAAALAGGHAARLPDSEWEQQEALWRANWAAFQQHGAARV